MLTIYSICLIVGGFLILASILFGGDGAEMDSDIGGDADISASLEGDFDGHVDGPDGGGEASLEPSGQSGHLDSSGHSVEGGIWLPFFSLRFWIFGSAFFGLTGIILTLFRDFFSVKEPATGLISGGVGLAIGWAAAYLFRFLLTQESTNSLVKTRDYVGKVAEVVFDVAPGRLGKISVKVGEREIQLLASTDEEREFQKGDRVFIIGFKDNIAEIVTVPKELR